MPPVLVFVGPPGSGKSTTARRLSAKLPSWRLVDSDAVIADAEGMPCGDIIRTSGEPHFRQLEAQVIADLLDTASTPTILSLGGGAVVTASTRERLADLPVVYLHVDPVEGVRRTSDDPNRPLLESSDRHQAYAAMLNTRGPWYEEVASLRINTVTTSLNDSIRRILDFLIDEQLLNDAAPASDPSGKEPRS